MSANKLPRNSNKATPVELATVSVKNLGDLLETIRDGVLVVANDIDAEQHSEIIRELGLMRVMNERSRTALNLPKVPRSCHLQRD